MNSPSVPKTGEVINIPVHEKGPVPPPFCIKDLARGDSMVLSSPEGILQNCFLARHKIMPGKPRGRACVNPSLAQGTKYIFLTEGSAKLLVSTQLQDKKVLAARSLEMKAPSAYAVPPGEACVLIPLTSGEFIELSTLPHKTLAENTTAVDFGEHLTGALSALGFE